MILISTKQSPSDVRSSVREVWTPVGYDNSGFEQRFSLRDCYETREGLILADATGRLVYETGCHLSLCYLCGFQIVWTALLVSTILVVKVVPLA